MKRLFSGLYLSIAIAASTASALTITDTNNYGATTSGIYLAGGGASYADVFNITPAYNPATQVITSAAAEFYLWDANSSNPEVATISLGGIFFGSATNFAGSVLIDGNVVGSVLIDLQTDGILAFVVQNTTGAGGNARDFYFNRAILTAEVENRPTNSVPDGGPGVTMLGASLACLIALRSFRRK